MTEFRASSPPDLPGIPSAEGPLPGPDRLVGRPRALPVDLLGELHGPLFYADFNGGFRKLYACSLELVTELCDESRFAKNLTATLARVRPLAGDGLFTAYHGEPNWQRAHDVLLPGFSYAGLRAYHPAMLDINCKLIERWDASTGVGPVDVSTDLQKLAMDTVALAGFGSRFESFECPGLAPIPQSFTTALGELTSDTPTPVFTEELATLHTFIDGLIAEHQSGDSEFDDLLALMLQQDPDGKPVLETQNIRNQIMTFLIAGQLTTSELMPNTLYNIVSDPTVLHRVQAEVDSVFGTDDDYLPGYDDIGKLTYLRQVIEETLRLSPPVLNFDRMALDDTVIGGRYPIKRGEAVTVLTGALHRQPQWGDNVELFDPDRFAPERSASRPAALFKPFGTGARSCIGRQFALHEAAIALARLVHRYRLIDAYHYVPQWETPTSRRPVGFRLEVLRRTPQDRQTDTAAVEAAAGPNEAQRPTVIRAGTRLAVLFGSNLGTCRALARQFADDATALGCAATVAPLDDAVGGFPDAEAVVIIASSYNGQPTDDARAFLTWLLDADTTLSPTPNVAVLGVGDHNWADTYQAIPQRIDDRLGELGANRLVPRAGADTSGDMVGTIEEFAAALWSSLAERFGDPDAAPLTDAAEPLYELRRIVGPVTAAMDARSSVIPMTIVENTQLVRPGLGQAKTNVRVDLPDGVDYQTGDHLTVMADNPPEVVDAVLAQLGIDPGLRLAINPRRSSRRLIALDREVSARELLTHFVELRKPVTSSQLRSLAAANSNPEERQRLNELAEAPDGCPLSVFECLDEYPACVLTGAELLELLDPMVPRHYSIASSSMLSPRTVGLVVSVLDAPARSGHGLFKGVASNYLATVQPGQVIRARVDPARQAFRAGADPAKNVILVSAGTGVAPFLGFLGDRLAAQRAGAPVEPALCFFGVRDPEVDYIFRDRFEQAEAIGIVQMRPAFSRAPQDGVRYVQDRIAADADEVWNLLGDPAKDTHVYVCGDGARMAPAVRGSFLDIYRARTGAGGDQARDWLNGLIESDHYVEDVWAG
ncbi:bifunctional cytochrome P450/NADPH--P450 reductase [Mycobacterium mantenii]|uniref:Bifunctional cytochrome P450/NADPH--P450 reductase n=1 Tax=Mycobacterium mantenii TaxID=560555 RepID=A0A1A2SYE4_MYCNT|nr:cytochrome P450 [Mycobacterium mantenii]OBH41977.1 cytochrome [Mycobacterium mantenii]OBH69179.1 cytochrome [Mycobacterium mantenii]